MTTPRRVLRGLAQRARYWEPPTTEVEQTTDEERPTPTEPPLVSLCEPVYGTRASAIALVASRPDVDPATVVYLGLADVEIVTPSFAHELLKAWPRLQLAGASKEVALSFDVVRERLEADHAD
jgi:hypothetical protein